MWLFKIVYNEIFSITYQLIIKFTIKFVMPSKGEDKINNRHSKILNQTWIRIAVCEEN